MPQTDEENSFQCKPKLFEIQGRIDENRVLQHPLIVPLLKCIVQGRVKEQTNILDSIADDLKIKDLYRRHNRVYPELKIDRIVAVQASDEPINEELMTVIKNVAATSDEDPTGSEFLLMFYKIYQHVVNSNKCRPSLLGINSYAELMQYVINCELRPVLTRAWLSL